MKRISSPAHALTWIWRAAGHGGAVAALAVVVLLIGVAGLLGAVGHGAGTNARTGDGGRMAHVPGPGASPGVGGVSSATSGGSVGVAASGSGGVAGGPGSLGSGSGAADGTSATSLPGLPAGSTGQSARIEETGTLTLIVPGAQIQPDMGRLTSLALASGGFVADSETQSASPGSPAQGTVSLQVPQPSFQSVLDQVRGLGRVSTLSTKATDVTGQYVDLQARITALENSRQQYLTIMTKATTIGDVLSVQQQLDDLQSQLEQLQGQQQVLDSETTYATLDVTLSEKLAPAAPKPESGLVSAWRAAVSGFVAGAEGVVRVGGPLLFAILLIVALVLLGRWAWHLRRAASGGPSAPATTAAR